MNRKTAFLMTGLIAAFFAIQAAAQSTDSRSADFSFASEILGEEVAITVYLPVDYDGQATRYPCLYVLEDDLYHRAMTGLLDTRARLGSSPEMIVVGVSISDRWRDFTPTRAGVPGGETIPVSGGAGNHRAFLENELIPHIEREFRTQPFRMLSAHSLGGLYALDTMLEAPDLFGAYLVTSPSLWWDEETTTRLAAENLDRDFDPRARLFLATGNEDSTIQDPVDRFCALLKRDAPRKMAWTRITCPESSHQEVPIRSFCDGLDFVFADWALPAEAMEKGIEAVDAHYAMLSKRFGYRIEAPEPVLNRFGYQAMNAGDLDGAVALFRRNTEAYPQSANVHDSLGEAYRAQGKNELARASYERALALDPASASARRALEELRPVTSGGMAVGRDQLLGLMEQEWGSRPDMKMWTENFHFECAPGNARIFTYEEHGESGGHAKATLITAVLRVSDHAGGGLEWVHLHETEIANQPD